GAAEPAAGWLGTGTAASLLDLVATCGGLGGRCSACQRSQRKSADKKKIPKRMKRWVSMNERPPQGGPMTSRRCVREPGRTRPGDKGGSARCGVRPTRDP